MKLNRAITLFLLSFLVTSQEIELVPDDLDLKDIIAAQELIERTETFDEDPKEIVESTVSSYEDDKYPKFGYGFINRSPTNIVASSDLPVPNSYRVSINDELKIILTGTKKEIFDLVVQMDGTVFFPQLGSIQVSGQTFSDVKNMLSNLISNSYVGVNIDISLGRLSAKKINIIGAVKTPGTYLVNPFTTMSSSLAYSGGVEDYASLRNIELIKPNGEKFIFDLYDLLINGDRTNDIVVGAGDTVKVSGTTNFVSVEGEVLRKMIYEYKESDTLSDLIKFSMGLTNNAEKKNIYYVEEFGREKLTKKFNETEKIGKKTISSIFIGSKTNSNNLMIMVTGSSVSSGYYHKPDSSLLSDLISELEFSSDIYPYYAEIEQTNETSSKYFSDVFSLVDLNKKNDIELLHNVKISFFSREQIFEEVFNDQIEKKSLKLIKLGEEDLFIPIVGKFTVKDFYEYLGSSYAIDTDNISIISEDLLNIKIDESLTVNSQDFLQISFPKEIKSYLEVTISGQIERPGKYLLNNGATLDDLYRIAGGFTEEGFISGVNLNRKSVVDRELLSQRNLNKSLIDSLVLNSNTSDTGQQSSLPLDSVLAIIEYFESNMPEGRISGDLSPGSAVASSLVLEDGDEIFIPSVPTTISVLGEVLSPITLQHNKQYKVSDYINASGGLTKNADKKAIFIIKASGEGVPIKLSSTIKVEPGDIIVIPGNYQSINGFALMRYIVDVFSGLSLSAAALKSIN